jgi:hypothetical protein
MVESFGSGIDDNGWSEYDRNSANKHWSHESRLGQRNRIGPLQNSQEFGQHIEKRAKSLPSQFGQKYDHNSARNIYPKPFWLVSPNKQSGKVPIVWNVPCTTLAL